MLYDIVIPHYGASERITELARRCLASIRKYSQVYRLIWVDNGGTEVLMDELGLHQELYVIRMGMNRGFVRAVNAGLAVSSAPYVVVMNNDTEAVPCWLEYLAAPLKGQNGVSGPRTTTSNSWQGRYVSPSMSPMVLSKTTMVAFFCTMFRRDVIQKVGFLDEDFGVGLGDDDDYCRRVHQAGFDIVWVPEIVIPHHHRTTFKTLYTDEQVAEMQKTAMVMMREKALAAKLPELVLEPPKIRLLKFERS